jgi:hypothetical protein
MADVVFDTNVPVVANGLARQASETCVQACIDRLLQSRAEDVILVDHIGLIFEEYQRYLMHRGQPGAGDAFFKWLWDNQANESHCRRVQITSIHPDPRGFWEFPDDPRLATFDASDRKFVAVAVAVGSHPPIVNASDTDWWNARDVLAEHGVNVEFVCPELMDVP